MENAARFSPLAHRSAAAHKLHRAPVTIFEIRESQNHLSGPGLSLFRPGGCPGDRDHRKVKFSWCQMAKIFQQRSCFAELQARMDAKADCCLFRHG